MGNVGMVGIVSFRQASFKNNILNRFEACKKSVTIDSVCYTRE
jgi:hypothetical protein